MPSAAKTVTLTNTGTAALTLGGIAVVPMVGPGASFATSNNCPASLPVGSVCNIRVRFVPWSSGYKVSKLTILDNAGNSPQTVLLSGKSKGSPAIRLTPSGLLFLNQANATKSPVQTIELANTGDAELKISSIVLDQGNPLAFETSNNCSRSLAAGSSCTIRVRYFPHHGHESFSDAGFIVVTDDTADSPHYVLLDGSSRE